MVKGRETAMSTAEPAAHLLIVDDEASVRAALRRMLRKEAYRLTCVASAADALKVVQDDPPDVVISDHLMPEMTGLELMKRLRLRCPHVTRIVLTGQAEMATVIAAINEGEVFRFLRKPWDEDELKLTVHLAVIQAREAKAGAQSARSAAPAEVPLRALEAAYPGIVEIQRDADGAIVIDDDEFAAS